MSRLFNEPVMVAAAIRAIILTVAAFGVNLSGEQIATLMVAVEAVLGLINRTLVTPNHLAERRVDLGLRPTEKING